MPTSTMTDERDLAAPLPGDAEPPDLVFVNVFDARLAPAGHLGSRVEIEFELDEVAAKIRQFYTLQPDTVMRMCAAYTARLTELEVLLHRVENRDRTYKQVRTMQVDRFLTELDRQFKIASRLVEVQRQDIDMLRGAGA